MEFVAFMKEKNRLTNGCLIKCGDCKLSSFHNGTDYSCETFMFKCPQLAERILEKWIEEDRKNVGWSKLAVDTLIEVSEGNGIWKKRYFSEYDNGDVYVWSDGATSYTTQDQESWKYNRLIKEEK